MAVSFAHAPHISDVTHAQNFQGKHVFKRRKIDHASTSEDSSEIIPAQTIPDHNVANLKEHLEDEETILEPLVPPHPLHVKPLGNAYDTATRNIRQHCGFFALLPDEPLLDLLDYLNAGSLLALGATCKALHAFTRVDDIWRALFIESPPPNFKWQGSWRSTFLCQSKNQEPKVSCEGLFSDVLYRPFHCAYASLDLFVDNIPVQNAISRMPDLSADEYQSEWSDKPFILTEPVKHWPVYRDWSLSNLLQEYSRVTFRAEAVDWPLADYVSYMNSNADESPLYLFDCRFVEKMDLSVDDISPTISSSYVPPPTFSPDLFRVLDHHNHSATENQPRPQTQTETQTTRPNHRWLILGPPRSGSTFHQDPNGTSAWNAVLRGAKYWLMFPPTSPPPGIHLSPDHSTITAPLSITEYLLAFHADARRHPHAIEAVCRAGEVLHVPAGWFHMVVNLERDPEASGEGGESDACIAITQNFVSRNRRDLANVLDFLKNKPEQVSGFKGLDAEGRLAVEGQGSLSPYNLFVARLAEEHGEVLAEALEELEEIEGRRKKRTRWEEVTSVVPAGGEGGVDAGGGAGFSFGFGFDEEDEGNEDC